MSTKEEEKAAFEKLKKEFPGFDTTLKCVWATYQKVNPEYYATVINGQVSFCGVGNEKGSVEEAVDWIINKRKEEKDKKEKAKAEM